MVGFPANSRVRHPVLYEGKALHQGHVQLHRSQLLRWQHVGGDGGKGGIQVADSGGCIGVPMEGAEQSVVEVESYLGGLVGRRGVG